MKQLLIAFFSFSRIERLGIALMSLLLSLLAICLATMRLWVHRPDPIATDARLRTAYLDWKRNENRLAMKAASVEVVPAGVLFPFDPNTLDSAGFIRLGMPSRAINGLLSWRRKGKRFYRPIDLKPLYNLPEEQYSRLEPFIRIAEQDRADSPYPRTFSNPYPEIPAVIDLNEADSSLLDRGINGIGATLARKIVARREALGGFFSHEQLLEIYKFPDSTFQHLKKKLRIDPATVRRMGLNTVTIDRLNAHPYVGERVAKNILLYREGIRRYERIEQLREAPLMSEEIYRKIAPYFIVD